MESLAPSDKKTVDSWVANIGPHPTNKAEHHHAAYAHTDHAFSPSDPHRVSLPVDGSPNHHVVISRHPHDVGGMSTGKPWKS
jgi:hypothetical protein